MDDKKELQLTPDVRSSIAKNLNPAAQYLYAGESVSVIVPDYDTGRALVEGDEAILKQLCEEMIGNWEQGRTHFKTLLRQRMKQVISISPS